MAFTYVQFIAYEVPTALAIPAGQCDLDQVKICEEPEKDPVFEQSFAALSTDAKARVSRLLTIIDLIRTNEAATKDKATLKVFMAPEFYFRPQDGSTARSYSAAEMNAMQTLFRLVFSQKLLSDWLCVLGTIVWTMKGKVLSSGGLSGSPDREKYLKALQDLANKDMVYNTALVAIGGLGLQVYDKVHYSTFDAIQKSNWPSIQKKRPQSYQEKQEASDLDYLVKEKDQSLRTELYDYFTHGGMQNTQCVINTANLHFGLEVCRDHQQGVLSKGYATFQNTWRSKNNLPAPKLDLQLLTACGMAVQRPSVVVGQGRYVFRVDGVHAQLADTPGRFDHSEIQKVRAIDDNGNRTMLDASTSPDEWKALNKPDVAVDLSGDLAMNASGLKGYLPEGSGDDVDYVEKDLDEVFKQRLVVYPRIKLR